MFEGFTFETLMERMLLNIPANTDKREGSVIWDALAAASMELVSYYFFLDMVINEVFADTASYYYLAKRAAERGIIPYPAKKAVLKAVFEPDTVDIPEGARFNLGVLNYGVTEKIENGIYKLMCETEGTEGNKYFGKILPIDYIDGLKYGEITELLIPGEDDEDIDLFRKRYFSSFNSEAFGGNIADYKEKVGAIQGTGGIKVYPAYFGGGTVRIVITDSDYGIPTAALIEDVQNKLDPPESNQGMGLGLAPIGHVVTVEGVKASLINVKSTITVRDGLSFNDIKSSAAEAVDAYFKELAEGWEDANALVVRISQIESRLLNIDGIIDIYDTQINEQAGNFILDSDSIPVRGDISAII